MHTTNYRNTFIEVAEDCPVKKAEIPPQKEKTVASLQYELLISNPYKYTSDDLIFKVYAQRNEIPESHYTKERNRFFSKGQACMRCSPLAKRYGWGVHANKDEKIAIYPVESKEYQRYASDKILEHTKAMRSKRCS